MVQSLGILSRLPGTGKSTLAALLARDLQWPLLCLDDVVDVIPDALQAAITPYEVGLLLPPVNSAKEIQQQAFQAGLGERESANPIASYQPSS